MNTVEQVTNGIINYIDREVIPKLPTSGKWMVGTAAAMAAKRSKSIMSELVGNQYMKMLGAVNQDGLIDTDLIVENLKATANKYGKLQLSFPIVGNMTFDASDIDALRRYIG